MSTPVTTAARTAPTRDVGAQRILVGLVGLLGVIAGALALLAGSGLFGRNRANRPVLDPLVLDALRAHDILFRGIALVAGVIALVLGLIWVARELKPERRPNLILDPGPDSRLEVSASAIADALRADAEALTGVNRARVRMVGTTAAPVVRLNLWLDQGSDIRDVYHDLDTRILAPARTSLGIESLPTAIHIELETVAAPRVS